MLKKKLAIAAVVLATTGLLTAGVAPAQATGAPTLPAGENFFAASCDLVSPQLMSVDTTSGNATFIGDAHDGGCASNAAVNPVDGNAYMVIYAMSGNNLVTVDPATGVFTVIAPLAGESSSLWGLTITNEGNAFGIDDETLYSLNLTSGATTAVGTELGFVPDEMGYNPVDKNVYAFEWNAGTSTLLAYTINTSTGVATADPSHNITMADYSFNGSPGLNLYALQGVSFDGNGNPWFVNNAYDSELIVADFATGAATFIAEITNLTIRPGGAHDFYTQSIFITGTFAVSALPDTGASAIAFVSTGAIGAGLLGAGALALIMVRRRQAGK
jgi:hypothetical protein